MPERDISFLVLAKEKPGLAECVEFLRSRSHRVTVVIGNWGDPFPTSCTKWEGGVIISYLSPWVVPPWLLKRAGIAAVNFHPGPPEHPGIGCTNFAIYKGEAEYGVTAHHMAEKVDAGRIIAVRRFPVLKEETVFSLTQRCYEHLTILFRGVMAGFFSAGRFPVSHEQWKREPYKRKDLEELCRITVDMPEVEVARRIKATTYPGMPGAYIEIYGYRFECSEAERRTAIVERRSG